MCHTFAHRLVCPWCEKGEVLSNASQQVVISVRCPRCGHVFLADLLGLKTERAAAQKRTIYKSADCPRPCPPFLHFLAHTLTVNPASLCPG